MLVSLTCEIEIEFKEVIQVKNIILFADDILCGKSALTQLEIHLDLVCFAYDVAIVLKL